MDVEYCDIYDRTGTHTGKTLARGTKLTSGDYYLVVQVWIRDEYGNYLIQKRAPQQTSPNLWATTAGYVQAGECSIDAAIRETHEEMGLKLPSETFQKFNRLFSRYLMQDIWMVESTRAAIGIPQPGPEVSDWQWATKSTILEMLERGEFFDYKYIDSLPA